MITREGNVFCIQTRQSTYVFQVLPGRQLEHLYYGRKIRLEDTGYLQEKRVCELGNTICSSQEDKALTLENLAMECSFQGTGDIREAFAELIYEDGSRTSDFLFEAAEISEGTGTESIAIEEQGEMIGMLPGAYDEYGKAEHLMVTLKERYHPVLLELHYYVYPDCDVITRRSVIRNMGTAPVTVKRLMSLLLDFYDGGYRFSSFHGAWIREMNREDMMVQAGRAVCESVCGVSSSRANPFVMVSHPETTEEYGECYGMNLIYSGNHYESLSVGSFGKSRFVSGLHPSFTNAVLREQEAFYSPEAMMTFSHQGFQGMSQKMHRFIREHIVRGTWKNKERPILMNSWEAAYFDFDERKLLKLARAGAELGIELFVLDDGWFGQRNDDTSSLGDWKENPQKLPGGLRGISDKIRKLGMEFGIWVEPEMVNEDSECFRKHPDWAVEIPGQHHAKGRNQKLLDLSKREVQDYLIGAMRQVFSKGGVSYVKWDMNRIFSDYYSVNLPAERQGELAHRYVLGLYRMMDVLTKEFPDILFEGCAAGGNRFDPGILCYFPQIWASDNTDAVCRSQIQYGYSYGYPMSVISAHVSGCPNHQTLRKTPLSTRFSVAAFGILGYECNLAEMDGESLEAVKQQVALYKKWRGVLQFGNFFRGSCGNITSWNVVSEDKKKAVGMVLQQMAQPNSPYLCYRPKGLAEDRKYHFYNHPEKFNIREFGDLINQVAPIHIKPDSLLHNTIARFVKMEGETEDYEGYGSGFMYGGVRLHQGFCGTGYNDKIRLFQDYFSRMYFMEEQGE